MALSDDERRARNRAYTQRYRARNVDKARELSRRSYAKNKQKRRDDARRVRRDQPERQRAADAKYRRRHPDRIKEIRQRYNEKHRDKILKRSRQLYAENAEACREQARAWYAKNRDRILAGIRRKKYGLSDDEIQRLLIHQGGLCAACLRPFDRKLAVDHDHKTGTVRGLLCLACNMAIGHACDSADTLRMMAEYLERTGQEQAVA